MGSQDRGMEVQPFRLTGELTTRHVVHRRPQPNRRISCWLECGRPTPRPNSFVRERAPGGDSYALTNAGPPAGTGSGAPAG